MPRVSAAVSRIIPALDVSTMEELQRLLAHLAGTARWAKVGMEVHAACGRDSVARVAGAGLTVMLDLKFHDIPRTVARAVTAHLTRPGIGMLTVHASGGREMIAQAAAAAHDARCPARVLAVTVLTSLGENDAREIFGTASAREQVLRLAHLAREAGADGVVASPQEAAAIRGACGPDFLIVTPGIRAASAAGRDDQKRVASAAEAARVADYLVVGRPIAEADDPRQALLALAADMAAGEAEPSASPPPRA